MWSWPLVAPALVVVAVAVLAAQGSNTVQRVAITMLINLVVVLGLYMLVGNSGVLSFGHIGFMAIGAYVSALLTIPPAWKAIILPNLPHFLANVELATVPAAVIAGCAAALAALITGIPLMRLVGIAAGIGTFALLIIVYVVANNWESVTAGNSGVVGVPLDVTLTTAAVWSVITMAAAYLFQQQRIGLRLRAAREDVIAARAVGIRVVRDRIIAFVFSAFFVGVAGALYAHHQGAFNPNSFHIRLTFVTFAMLIIGGVRSLAGAVVGTLTVSVLAETLRRLEGGFAAGPVDVPIPPGIAELILATVMLVILLFRPRGITGGSEIYWPWQKIEIEMARWPRHEAHSRDEEGERRRFGTGAPLDL